MPGSPRFSEKPRAVKNQGQRPFIRQRSFRGRSVLHTGLFKSAHFSKNCLVTVPDEDANELEQRKLSVDRSALLEYFWKVAEPAKLAVEATFNWHHFLNVVEPLGFELHVVQPLETKANASAGMKHDKPDSRTLAQLRVHREALDRAAAGAGAAAVVAAPDADGTLRHAGEERRARRAEPGGVVVPTESLIGAQGRAFLEEVKLRELDRWEVDDQLERFDLLQQQVGKLDHKIRERFEKDVVSQALDGIPGIEPFIAVSLVAEIGDLAQFSSPKHLSYVGLAPSLYASGKRRWTGHITNGR